MDATQPEEQPPDEETPQRQGGDDQFLMPGPTSTSNEGALRWGLSWLLFSIFLMALVGLMSFVCWWLATTTGIA
jgi:hypothetical protein